MTIHYREARLEEIRNISTPTLVKIFGEEIREGEYIAIADNEVLFAISFTKPGKEGLLYRMLPLINCGISWTAWIADGFEVITPDGNLVAIDK